MIHKSSMLAVLEVFFKEPTKVHFIREISRKISLAQTSTRNNTKYLLKEGLIKEEKGHPFDGLAANRESEQFILYKKLYNFYSLEKLKKRIVEEIYPTSIVLFGSYSRGEDIETSDIDILILSKLKKELSLEIFEKELGRKINIMFSQNMDRLDKPLRENILNGFILYGHVK